MTQPVHTQGLITVEFDWELFDKQPRSIKELTWYAVGNGVSFPALIPAHWGESFAAKCRERLDSLKATNAALAYGPDHPQATLRTKASS